MWDTEGYIFNILYLIFEALRLLTLVIFSISTINYLMLARQNHMLDYKMIVTLIFLNIQLLAQVTGSVLNFVDRDLN